MAAASVQPVCSGLLQKRFKNTVNIQSAVPPGTVWIGKVPGTPGSADQKIFKLGRSHQVPGLPVETPVDQESCRTCGDGCRCAGTGDRSEISVFVYCGNADTGGRKIRLDLFGTGIATTGVEIKTAVFCIVGADCKGQKRSRGIRDRGVGVRSQKNSLGGNKTGNGKPELKIAVDIEVVFHPQGPDSRRRICKTDKDQLVSGGLSLIHIYMPDTATIITERPGLM